MSLILACALSVASSTAEKDLQASLGELTALRESIQAEKLPLSEGLGRLEGQLASLRRDLDETTRSQDTKALELGNLQAAMKLRQDETAYVAGLLDEYVRGFEGGLHVSESAKFKAVIDAAKLAREDEDLGADERFGRQVEVLRASLGRLMDVIGGTRYDGQAVDAKGVVAQGEFAAVGPIVLFAAQGGVPAGLALPQAGSTLAAVRAIDEAADKKIAQVVATGEGDVPLDPSRGGALAALIHRGSLLGYFKKGGPIMYPLLLVSVLALTVILERLFFLTREKKNRQPKVIEAILGAVAEGDVRRAIRAGEGTT